MLQKKFNMTSYFLKKMILRKSWLMLKTIASPASAQRSKKKLRKLKRKPWVDRNA